MKKMKVLVLSMIIVLCCILIINFIIYHKYTKNILLNLGDLSRMAYSLDYINYQRNTTIDNNSFRIIKNICELDKTYDIMTIGDSYMNGANEKTYIQNYINNNLSIVHLASSPRLSNINNILNDECFHKYVPKKLLIEIVERGLNSFLDFQNINKNNDYFFNNKLKNTSNIKFLNSANIKFTTIRLFEYFKLDTNLISKLVPSFYPNNTLRKELNQSMFSINSNILFFSKSSYTTMSYSENHINKLINNIKIINKKTKLLNAKLIFMVIPEKLTLYNNYLKVPINNNFYSRFYKKLDENKIKNINLLKNYKNNINNVIDIYQPDDTHLSRNGARLTGQIISNNLP